MPVHLRRYLSATQGPVNYIVLLSERHASRRGVLAPSDHRHSSLPEPQHLAAHLDAFFARIWPIYPVVDRQALDRDIEYFNQLPYSSPNGPQANLVSGRIPQLVSIFSIIAIASDEAAGQRTDLGDTYLTAAYSLFAHVVATPYLASVQALFLLAVALRLRCKDGQSWHILAQAIRVAHSLGLHRFIRPRSRLSSPEGRSGGYQTDLGLNERIWWSCYALEKLMELETGRPSAIDDGDIDQIIPVPSSTPANQAPAFFTHWVGLARILSQINKQLYRHKPNSAWELISEVGKLDQQLQGWVNTLPEGIRPGHDELVGQEPDQSSDQQHITTFLSLQYYQVCP